MHADALDTLTSQLAALNDHRQDIDTLTTTLHDVVKREVTEPEDVERVAAALDALALSWAQMTIAGALLVDVVRSVDRG